MALSFLADAGGFAAQATPVASGIGSILELFNKKKQPTYVQPNLDYSSSPAEMQANSLLQALLDPNNSLVKQNTQDNMQQGVQQFLMQLRAAQMLDNRQMARGGRSTFFNPERADETVDYLVSRGLPGLQQTARTNAINDIKTAASGFQSQAGSYYNRQAAGNAANIAEARRSYDDRLNIASQDSLKGGLGGKITQVGTGIQNLFKSLDQSNYAPWLNGVSSGTMKPNPFVTY